MQKLFQPNHPEAANISLEHYQEMQKKGQAHFSNFWAEIARDKITWDKDFTIVDNVSFASNDVSIKWFEDGMLNACYNAVDRHAETMPDKTALIWESDDGQKITKVTYKELQEKVAHFAGILKMMGVQKGDPVIIYMPMILEASYAMLACVRIGAVHCVVFGGFSPAALSGRIETVAAKWVITADQALRGGKIVPLKENVNKALEDNKTVKNVLIVQHTFDKEVAYKHGRDIRFNDIAPSAQPADPVSMSAEDPLFILHTSGSTGTPKGLVHTIGGYCVNTAYTHDLVFDLKNDDVFFCTADVGWITGHSYMVYGPLMNGTTVLMYEGVPTYPDAGRMWEICEKHNVTILYTAPTALRTLMGYGNDYVTKSDLSSLRILGTVGEPINPEVWQWYYDIVGGGKTPIVDTWWQTETGAFMIAPVANTTPMKAGIAGQPLPSIHAKIVDVNTNIVKNGEDGHLVFSKSWPSQARTIWGDHKRFMDTYFSTHSNHYFCGDAAKQDEEGYIQIIGRTDDVLNVSGHRLGTAEIESALVLHPSISEAAVVGCPHDIKGQGVYAYLTLMQGHEDGAQLRGELKALVRQEIGPIANIDMFHFTPDMPKTRSGKIMRRILRKIAENDYETLGDISTLANPDIVGSIIEHHKKSLAA